MHLGHMALQIRSIREALLTHSAQERLEAGVGLLVSNQVGLVGERRLAILLRAFERFRAEMNSNVIPQVLTTSEFSKAHIAFKVALLRMNRFQMHRHASYKSKETKNEFRLVTT